MRSCRLPIVILLLLALPAPVIAGKGHFKARSITQRLMQSVGARHIETYILEFVPTQNAPAGARGVMSLKVENGKTIVHFRVRGAYPNTIYTIWTVFNKLRWPLPTTGTVVPADPPGSGFPREGNGVSPLARLDDAFTSGMRLDPGASFVTNGRGDGEIEVTVDYDVVREAPVSNKDVILQCAPVSVTCERQLRVTTTWLRRFIGEFPLADRAATCANYDPGADPDSPLYDPIGTKETNARFWQCIDPATVDPHTGNGLPRVHRFEFDHFRLANHPDDLTHGFIGGNHEDHWIDMVGRRCDLRPPVGPPCP